ncbi:hypothetical protein DTO013E5_2726 [Penicillium roqueforti]|nr:hypothetical protein CBS147372_6218 [Penicillium roqueforti]KAI2738108.1 hypothetical protein DTO012A1_7022 [Penicillium roqueforti]KAI2749365.1 hypothetical protein DTO013F2_5661 [Penicillium roqueforti]KAI3153279.1 hypothetical protein CBS147317_6823 [Penicillium roqueforti]KAI3180265.1 hypothetical protein DTO046C5_1501 [Penicillium roqueforti]
MRGLLLPQLETVVSRIAQCLDLLQIDYALMGGAAVCFMAPHPSRRTEDVDLVIHVDQRYITADLLTQRLLNAFPADFGPVNQFGHVIPAFRLRSPSGTIQLIEWRTINGYPMKIFGAEWLTREKILSQYQRQGPKHLTDIEDIARLSSVIENVSLPDFGHILQLLLDMGFLRLHLSFFFLLLRFSLRQTLALLACF